MLNILVYDLLLTVSLLLLRARKWTSAHRPLRWTRAANPFGGHPGRRRRLPQLCPDHVKRRRRHRALTPGAESKVSMPKAAWELRSKDGQDPACASRRTLAAVCPQRFKKGQTCCSELIIAAALRQGTRRVDHHFAGYRVPGFWCVVPKHPANH